MHCYMSAVEDARAVDDPQALAYALYVRRWTWLPPGDLESKLADSDEILALARRSGLHEIELAARSCRFLDLVECGRLSEADHELALYQRLVDEVRAPRYRWRARFYRAMRALLEGRFTAVQQAVGTAKANQAGAAFLRDFVEEAKASGLVARLIERHHIRGLSVAPPA